VRIDQFVPGFAPHDAIGNHVLQIRRVLREAGFESDIYGEWIVGPYRHEARPWTESPTSGRDRIFLYHASTHSDMVGWLIERAEEGGRLLSDYHNITPSSYYTRWMPEGAASMVEARRELVAAAPHVELALADSRFNEEELIEVGYRRTATCRLLVDLESYHDPPDRRTFNRLRRRRDAGGATWIFVGRVAPNKCQHDVMAAFAVYRRLFDPEARLTLVGGVAAPRYLRALQMLAGDLELGDSVEMLDSLSHAELLAHFAVADVFVCLSEHEGFCVPLLEAMEIGVPTVSYAAAAIPETVAATGVLLADKDPLEVAAAVAELLADETRARRLVEAGRERAATFALKPTSAHLLETLTTQIGLAPRR
jgi:glycosyltransferase involved in cell wall biosynthesis